MSAGRIGYVQNVHLKGLERLADKLDLSIEVEAPPGTLVGPGRPLLWLTGPTVTEACIAELRSQITVGTERTIDQDPLYGAQIMGEIAARALSPGINDPGGARDVLARTVTLVEEWVCAAAAPKAAVSRVTVRPLAMDELLAEALLPIAIHGASNARLQMDLQAALAILSDLGDPELARACGRLRDVALNYAIPALVTDEEREQVRQAAAAD